MKRHESVVVMFVLLALLQAGSAAAQRVRPPRSDAGAPERVPLAFGQEAPDFALPRLDPFLATNAAPEAAALETARLSQHRGKRPVVLIFSSFT